MLISGAGAGSRSRSRLDRLHNTAGRTTNHVFFGLIRSKEEWFCYPAKFVQEWMSTIKIKWWNLPYSRSWCEVRGEDGQPGFSPPGESTVTNNKTDNTSTPGTRLDNTSTAGTRLDHTSTTGTRLDNTSTAGTRLDILTELGTRFFLDASPSHAIDRRITAVFVRPFFTRPMSSFFKRVNNKKYRVINIQLL